MIRELYFPVLRFEGKPAPSRPAFTDFRASVEYSDRITGKQEGGELLLVCRPIRPESSHSAAFR
jgi:hypothetical protein